MLKLENFAFSKNMTSQQGLPLRGLTSLCFSTTLRLPAPKIGIGGRAVPRKCPIGWTPELTDVQSFVLGILNSMTHTLALSMSRHALIFRGIETYHEMPKTEMFFLQGAAVQGFFGCERSSLSRCYQDNFDKLAKLPTLGAHSHM